MTNFKKPQKKSFTPKTKNFPTYVILNFTIPNPNFTNILNPLKKCYAQIYFVLVLAWSQPYNMYKFQTN